MATAQELVQAAKERAKEKETVPIPFLDIEILFRLPEDATEHEQLKRNAEKEITRVKKTPSPATKPYKDTMAEVIRQAFWVSKLAVDPPFSLVEALELGSSGSYLTYLFQALMVKVGESVVVDEREEVDDAKNE